MRKVVWFIAAAVFIGCATTSDVFGIRKLDVPPEFNQKVLLSVDDQYQMHQAPRSGYDIGDLQSFHTQHTLPIVMEDAFKEMFGEVELIKGGPKIAMDVPDEPAIFEVRMIDLANDISFDFVDNYRAQVTVAVAMKSPRGVVFWQKAFRADGYVQVDSQWSTGMGPEEAVQDAMRDVINQIQEAIIQSPEVRAQLKYYKQIEEARRMQEVPI